MAISLIWASLTVTTANAAEQEPLLLRVKPELCITDKRRPACETSFLVEWESGRSDHYCLNDDFSATPLRCWQQESSGDFTENRTVTRSFSYLLTLLGQEQALAEARVELMTLDSSNRRKSRRNRHAWSVR